MECNVFSTRNLSLLIVCFFVPQAFAVIQLNSPSEFSNDSTVINFDDGEDLQVANTLYLSKGVEFSRDDGQGVAIGDWQNLDRTTTSQPNVLATIGANISGYPATTWSTHLNASFTVPVNQVGAYFGNDQGGDFNRITLIAYGENDNFLGSISMAANNNTSVDQFIALSSDELIHSVRFQNNGTYFSVCIDDFMFHQIPEPATLSLLALGAVLVRRKGKV